MKKLALIFIFWIGCRFQTPKGIVYTHLINEVPQSIHILDVDPDEFDIFPARALDLGLGRESVSSLAKRHGAIAGVNGGFFEIGGTYDGIPSGALKIDQKWYSLPSKPRGCIGWSDRDHEVHFERLLARASITINRQKIEVDGLNQPRGANDIILFSSDFSFTTLSDPGGVEISVKDRTISEINHLGSSKIPHLGWIVSLGPDRAKDWNFEKGDALSILLEALPQINSSSKEKWDRLDHIVGGTPLLIDEGKKIEDYSIERVIDNFLNEPHARTAVGIRPNGHWLFVVVDGKQPESSIGMTIEELASLMQNLGCTYALNLDGGGSSTMFLNGEVVNQPIGDEDEGDREKVVRRVSDVILIRSNNKG